MEVLIVLIAISIVLFSAGMFLVFQDKNRYIKEIKKESARIETTAYKNSQEYLDNKKNIEDAGIVDASAGRIFSIREDAMKKLNAPNTLFINNEINDSEKNYLLKFATVHGYDNSQNIDAIDEKVSTLMGYSSDD